MCGIFGYFSGNQDYIDIDILQKATRCLRHRGPDDEGYLLLNGMDGYAIPCSGEDTDPRLNLPRLETFHDQPFRAGLGFRRLAILDLTPEGHQPMRSSNSRYWAVLNGEIYNYIELRSELKALGFAFRSESDTEVLITAYACWGKGMLNKLVGMFAFAIIDTIKQTAFLARDFFGIKPLYYSVTNGYFAFASEIKAILLIPGLSRQANSGKIYQYLASGVTDSDSSTSFLSIKQLPAAHFLEIDLNHPEIIEPRRYWQLNLDKPININFEDAVSRVRELFLENVKLHLRSDVPVGAALSGGIDSSAIVNVMRYIQGEKIDLSSFTYLADDPTLNEEHWAEIAGNAAKSKIYKVKPRIEDLANDLESLVYYQDEPFTSTSIYAQYRVFRLAKEHGIKVMLDGQGADEMLAGYPAYLPFRMISYLRQMRLLSMFKFWRNLAQLNMGNIPFQTVLWEGLLPRSIRKSIRTIKQKHTLNKWIDTEWFKTSLANSTPSTPIDNPYALRTEMLDTLLSSNLPFLLRYEDRNSMAHSIESRVPYLTQGLVSFLFSLPEEYLIDSKGNNKAIFRQAMRGIVPNEILDRSDKIGFQTPEPQWLISLGPWVESVLTSQAATQIPFLKKSPICNAWNSIFSGKQPYEKLVWRIVNLILWAEKFHITF